MSKLSCRSERLPSGWQVTGRLPPDSDPSPNGGIGRTLARGQAVSYGRSTLKPAAEIVERGMTAEGRRQLVAEYSN